MKSRTIERSLADSRMVIVMPRTDEEYSAMVARLQALCGEVTDDSDPRNRVIETLVALIEKYDERHAAPDASPVEVLQFLIEQHGLKQGDLPEIGSQGVVSEILHGRRQFNLRQIQSLAARFGVEPGAFISKNG